MLDRLRRSDQSGVEHLLVVDLVQSRVWVRLKLPPCPTIIWAAIALLSCLWTESFPRNDTLHDWAFAASNPVGQPCAET